MGPVKYSALTVHDSYENLVRVEPVTGRTVQRSILLVTAAGAAKLRHSSIVQAFERSSTSYQGTARKNHAAAETGREE